MNDLEMSNAFSGLDGVEFYIFGDGGAGTWIGVNDESCVWADEYNPITDLALNCAARDKYKVEIDYDLQEVNIYRPKEHFPVLFIDYFDILDAVM